MVVPTATVAGQPYAISFAYLNQGGDGTLEYYATDGECGPVLEKLSSETMQYRKLICTNTVPAGNYEHLVMVWTNVSASLSDATFCPNVTCGDYAVTSCADCALCRSAPKHVRGRVAPEGQASAPAAHCCLRGDHRKWSPR